MSNLISNSKTEYKGKVALGLSGGVDSSVSAYLLKEQGYDVTAVYMQCWDIKMDGCAADEDKMYAIQSAAKLNIPIKILNFVKEYNDKVISYFYSEYKAGRTPNPDVMCNKEIKFGMFFDWAMENGFDYVATGHYAQVQKDLNTGDHKLLSGIDTSKDQSYFLYELTPTILSKTLFPIGHLPKKEVRKIAEIIGLPTANRPDSTGICFIGEVDIKEFLKQRIKEEKGNVILNTGEVIGSHSGVWFYTVGQRRGFDVSKYQGKPLYVIGKNVETNELIVGEEKDVYRNSFEIEAIHWLVPKIAEDFDCKVRIRHLGQFYNAHVSKNNSLVILDTSAFGIAPGQSVVFYKDAIVLGGAIIK